MSEPITKKGTYCEAIDALNKQVCTLTDCLNSIERCIYKYSDPAEQGWNALNWDNTNGPHIDPLLWDGPADPVSGFPMPTANPPTTSSIFNGAVVNDNNSSGIGLAARYSIFSAWVYFPPNTTNIRDFNANTGELGMVLLSDCCGGPLQEQEGGNHTVNTGGVDRTLMDVVPASEGWHYIYSPQSDQSAFGGITLQYSTDNAETFVNIPISNIRSDKPFIQEQIIKGCDPIPEGWSLKKPQECCQGKWINNSVFELEVCEGPFQIHSTQTGWWNGFTPIGGTNWSQIYNDVGNVDRVEGDWVPVGNSITSPDCITDMNLEVDAGNHYILSRRNRSYYWVDFRVLINGVAVVTSTFNKYWYIDETTDTNPEVIEPIQYNLIPLGVYLQGRLNVPASATVQVEAKQRYQTVASQSSSYFRVIGGLRSSVNYHFSPKTL